MLPTQIKFKEINLTAVLLDFLPTSSNLSAMRQGKSVYLKLETDYAFTTVMKVETLEKFNT